MEDNRKQLPNELSIEDLLESLDETNFGVSHILKDPNDDNDIFTFLTEFGIKPGKHIITSRFLYKMYKNWSKDPVSSTKFTTQLIDFFSSKLERKQLYFRVNKDRLKFSDILFTVEKKKKNKLASPKLRLHFEDFLTDFNLKDGAMAIPIEALHTLYKEWCIEKRKSIRLGYDIFKRLIKMYFPRDVFKADWARISNSVLERVSSDKIKGLIEDYKKETSKKKADRKKRELKKSKSVCSSGQETKSKD